MSKDRRSRAATRVMAGFDGHIANGHVKRLIRDFRVQSLILFKRNVDGPAQVADLVRELQGLALEAGYARPLLIAIDQEGGRVQRLRAPWTVWPPIRRLGDLNSEDLARRMAEAIAAELKACGIGLDFAPVVDVDTNPQNPIIGDRSFGRDPEQVGKLAVAFIEAMQGAGIAACAKHFPGHGDTDKDSHLDLPVVEHSRSRLEDIELRPFKKAIAAKVATIMTAHIVVRELDEKVPATLSPAVVTTLLRDELGYKGVIVADDLEMKAVSANWPYEISAVLAAKAGCDLLPVCEHEEAQVAVIEALIRAEESGELRRRDIDDALLRIEGMIDKYTLPYAEPSAKAAVAAAGRTESRLLAAEIAGVAL
jgi:beta-N-acetylhexosaminidase